MPTRLCYAYCTIPSYSGYCDIPRLLECNNKPTTCRTMRIFPYCAYYDILRLLCYTMLTVPQKVYNSICYATKMSTMPYYAYHDILRSSAYCMILLSQKKFYKKNKLIFALHALVSNQIFCLFSISMAD